MNNVVLIGRLTKDPELAYGGQNRDIAVCRFTLAVIIIAVNECIRDRFEFLLSLLILLTAGTVRTKESDGRRPEGACD